MTTSSTWEIDSILLESNMAINLYTNPISYFVFGFAITKNLLLIQISGLGFSVVIAGCRYIFTTYVK
jgi:hypothetical protein